MKILICFLYVIVHVFEIADCKPPGHHGHHPNSPDVLYATVKPKTPKPQEPTYENVGCRNTGGNHIPQEPLYASVNKRPKPTKPEEPIYGNVGHSHHGKHHHHKPGENEVIYGNVGDYGGGGHHGKPEHEPTYADLKFPSPGNEPIYDNVGFRGPCHHHKHKHHEPDSIYAEVKGSAPPGHRGPHDDNSIYGAGGYHHQGHHGHPSNDDEEIYGYVGPHSHNHNCAHNPDTLPPLPPRPPNGLPPIPGSRGGKQKSPKSVGCFGRR